MNRIFYSKILLFGEYSIILNGDALTIPYPGYSARLCIPGDKAYASNDEIVRSNKNLWSYFAFLKSTYGREYFNEDQFEDELLKGIYLESDIPEHYGLGSSGALVAAVYDRYFLNQEDTKKPKGLIRLKNDFSKMESYFHGRSSGIDPLSCTWVFHYIFMTYRMLMKLNWNLH